MNEKYRWSFLTHSVQCTEMRIADVSGPVYNLPGNAICVTICFVYINLQP